MLQGDVAQAVAALKQEDGEDLHLIGSSELVQTLVEHDLVDEFRVMIDPVVVGGGKRLFRDDGVRRALSGPFCKFVRGGHAACASCSWSSKRRSSRSRSDRVKCQSNGVAVCS
ncbi:MAG: dihydrofolate reductase family protein [Actinomycetes bacterium]